MKRYIKIVSYVLLTAFFAVALSGCQKNSSSEDPTANKIVVWSFEDEDVWMPIKRTFESDYEGFELVYEKQVLNSQYENRVLNSILSGSGPDVWSMPNDWVYRHKDKLYPAPEEWLANIDLDKDFVPSVKSSVYFDDALYALTPSSQPLMVYYNEKIFEDTLDEYNNANRGDENEDKRRRANVLLGDFPKTWTDFVETTKLLTKKDSAGNIILSGASIGTDTALNAEDILYLLMLQNETRVLSENFKLATFNLPTETPRDTTNIPGQRALEFYTAFSSPSHQNYTWNNSLGDPLEAFLNQKVAMLFGYSDLQLTLSQKLPSFKYKKAFVPQLSQDSDKIIDFAKFNAFGVSNITRNPGPSWGVIEALVFENASDFNSAMRLYSSAKAREYDISIAEREPGNPERLSLATAKSLPKGRYPLDFNTEIKTMIFSVNNSLSSPKSALDLAANNITEMLRKEDW